MSLATPEGTAAYAREHPAAPGHYRAWRGLTLSSLGFGSYLGDETEAADAAYVEAFAAGLRGGVNVLDTAANYRGRRSERAVGRALRASDVPREQVLLVTKGGFAPGAHILMDYVREGVIGPNDIVARCHVMSPRYLARELQQSLEGLGVRGVDAYLLHNPETQLENGVSWGLFEERLRECLLFLEKERTRGRIGVYGLATWRGLRDGSLPLERILDIAREIGGEDHGLRALELPYNLAMPEAARAASQPWRGARVPILQAARDANMLVLCSATLMQGQLLRRMPAPLRERLGASSVEAAIQFSRSTPGVTCALVGTGRPEHAHENLGVVGQPPRMAEAAALLGG